MRDGGAGISCPVDLETGIFEFALRPVCTYFKRQVKLVRSILADGFLYLLDPVHIIGLVRQDGEVIV